VSMVRLREVRTVMLVLGLGLDDKVLGLGLGLVIKSLALAWPCQFVLENCTPSGQPSYCLKSMSVWQCLHEFTFKSYNLG